MDLDDVLGDAAGSPAVTVEAGVAAIAPARPDRRDAESYATWSALGRVLPEPATGDAVEPVVPRELHHRSSTSPEHVEGVAAPTVGREPDVRRARS